MTLPASGNISLQNLASEYGGVAPHSILEYYRGGAYVPNAAPNLAVPTSGTVKLTDFYGGAGTPLVDLVGQFISASGGTGGAATARTTLTTGGLQQSKEGTAAYVTDNTWLNSGSASDYDARCTLVSDSGIGFTGGSAFGTWINMAGSPEWTTGTTVGNLYSAEFLIELRLVSSGVVLASATALLDSERF